MCHGNEGNYGAVRISVKLSKMKNNLVMKNFSKHGHDIHVFVVYMNLQLRLMILSALVYIFPLVILMSQTVTVEN